MLDARMPALRSIALVILATWGPAVHAAGLGPVRVQSALGQPLRATISLFGDDAGDITPNCVRARIDGPDGIILANAQTSLTHGAQGSVIRVTSNQSINEPAISLQLHITCGSPMHRVYPVLIDPVVILPQLAQTDEESRPRPARSVSSRVDAVVSSEASSRSVDTRTRSSRRKQRSAATAPSPVVVESTGKRLTVSRDMAQRKVVRNVLRLSGDDAGPAESTFSPGLKISDTLSESRDTGDPQKAAELKAAYERFQAAIRDEDLIQKSETQIKTMQGKLEAMEKEMALLKQQSQEDRTAAEELRKSWFSPTWISWFALLLLACLGAIGWLAMRLKETRRRPSFWEETQQVTQADDTESLSTISAHWDDTELLADTVVARQDEPTAAKTEGSDWEKGVPMDDTLAMNWAAQETARGADTEAPATQEDARPEPVANDAEQPRKSFPRSHAREEPPEFLRKPAAARSAKPVPAKADDEQQFQVEEVSDLLQEAEFWMLLNDPRRAIEILRPYGDVDNPVSPVPWIYLLDMYRVVGEKDKYEILKARAEKVFNTRVPAWADAPGTDAEHSLADYPHVVQAIQDLWEGDYIIPYLESLLFDDREGDRSGFDLSVYREIIHLIGVARDPDAKRQAELSFGKAQPRLISEQVASDSKKSSGTVKPAAATFQPQHIANSDVRPAVPVPELPEVDEPKVAAASQGLPSIPAGMPAGAPVSAPTPQTEPLAAATAAHADALAPDLSLSDQPHTANDEAEEHRADMARKLDLAVAYQEIGENVGARVLLEEVIQGGTELQVEKAKGMLKKLLKEIDWQ